MIKTRLVTSVLAALAALAIFTGCGSGGDESSSSDLASLAPPQTPLFVEGTLQPSGSLKTNVEALAKNVAGVDDLGGTIISQLESAASDEQFNYSENIEPWLGERAGIAFGEYDGDSFSNYVLVVQSTDTGATQDFIDTVAEKSDSPIEDGSYEGVDYKIESDNETTLGVIGDFLVFAQNEKAFKNAVDASNGESLAGQGAYTKAVAKAPPGALLEVYADIGALIEQSGGEVDAQTEQVLETAGIEVDEATALLSLVPGSDSLEIDLASDLGGGEVLSPPAEDLLESMPARSFAATGATEYGKRLQEGIDSLDAAGIPGQVPPHKLKSILKKEGIDLEQLAGSLDEAAGFAVGDSKSTLGGALVATTKSATEAKNTVANIGLLLRANHTPGVTAIGAKATGFSIRGTSIGPKPLVIAAKGDRIAIGYGLPATLEGLGPVSPTLAENAAFKEASKALGSTQISGFVDGGAALRLAENLVSPLDSGFEDMKPYLEKVDYIGLGGGSEGDLATLKLVAGFGH